MSENKSNNFSGFNDIYVENYDFIEEAPGLAISCIILLAMVSVIGTTGNIIILIVVSKTKELKQSQSIFIVNLAISDMYVTTIADPMSIVGKIEGRHFFDQYPVLCQIIGMLCTISCISSLGSIALLSFNRYIYICHNSYYSKLCNRYTCIAMCMLLYCVGLVLVLLNSAGIGNHGFDDKSLQCIWDRKSTYSYTVVFSVGLVWIPLIVVGISYCSLFSYVHHKRKQVFNRGNATNNTSHSFKLARTIFIVYTVFSVCWIPFAVLLVADIDDTFPHQLHLWITVFAHCHPSINCFIYYLTNGNFKAGFHKVFCASASTSNVDILEIRSLNSSKHNTSH